MKGRLAARLLAAAPAYKGEMEQSELKTLEAAMMGRHDGKAVFRRIMEWATKR